MNDEKEASEVLKPRSSQIEQPPASEPPEAVESQIIEQWDATAVGNESEIMGKLPSLDMIKDETIAVEGGRYQMVESSPVRSLRVFQSLLRVINDEDDASEALRPSSSQLEEPLGVQSSDVVEPQRTEHIDAVRVVNKSEISDKFPSMDVIKDEAGAREGVCCQMPDSSPTAAIHGETIHEAEALVVKDELTGGTEAIEARDSLLVDDMDYEFIREEVGALQENEEESEIEKEGQPSVVKDELTVKTEAIEAEESPRFADKDNELLRVSEGQAGKENIGESMIVMEEEWSVAVEKQGESWKGGGGEAEAELAEENDVKVEEMAFVAEKGGKQIMEGEVLAEMKSEELEGEKETSEVRETSLMNEEDGELRGGHEAERVMKGGDESKGDEEPAQLDVTDLQGSEFPLMGEDKEMAGKEQTEEMDDSQRNGEESWPAVKKSGELIGEVEGTVAGTEMEMEGDAEAEVMKSLSGGKGKRGRNSKVPVKASRKIIGEDVCFICLDGGDLVLCDRRGCPKAYHPSCVDRDEAFFRAKGRWNCGWHLCSNCEKNAYYLCYTCTFSLCKGCIKDAVIYCVRANKGLCETCMKTVMLIENNERGNDEMAIFYDDSQWEYLFKDYWMEQKEKLSLTSEEIAEAKNPWKGFNVDDKQETPAEMHEVNNEAGYGSDSSYGNVGAINSKRKKTKKWVKSSAKKVNSVMDSSAGMLYASNTKRKAKRQLRPLSEEAVSDSHNSIRNRCKFVSQRTKSRKLSKPHTNEGSLASQTEAAEGVFPQGGTEWASKELLEFVMHMKNGDKSVLSQFDVQELLLEYIKRSKLRDPRRRSQIVCDSMLEKLFGKPRVGHFEMLKLLESHFLVKEDSQADDNQGSVVDTEVSQLDVDENNDSLTDAGRYRGQKARKKGDERGFQSNLDDYAAIDMHNINLIYLRRNLMEALMESERFEDEVVGSFVRIRISGSGQKQDIYRLVQVVGTGKVAVPYKIGKRTTDITLEILNLDKTELISIDTISNQEFIEDECKRLRQSIKCGLICRLTVGDVLEKAKELREVRVTDWLEAEIVRLRHLCDRASDLGRKKELRECVERLQLLKKPEERQRRLDEIPDVHADLNMDPSYDSEDESETDGKKQESEMRQRETGSFGRVRDQFSSPKGGSALNDSSWSAATRPINVDWESSRSLSGRGFSSWREDASVAGEISGNQRDQGERGILQSNSWDKPTTSADFIPAQQAEYTGARINVSPPATSETPLPLPAKAATVVAAAAAQVDAKIDEAEKLWHYRDPSGKVQGAFSMAQLRKWCNTGYFPASLKIWRTAEPEDDSILLTKALAGRFHRETSLSSTGTSDTQRTQASHLLPAKAAAPPDVSSEGGAAVSCLSVTSRFSANVCGSDAGGEYDLSNLPSPTPTPSTTDRIRKQSRWSPAFVPPQMSSSGVETGQLKRGNEVLPPSDTVSSTPPPPMQDYSGNPVSTNAQQLSSQSTRPGELTRLQLTAQPLLPLDAATASTNPGQAVSNMTQSGAAQNHPVYDWGSSYVARPEMINEPNIREFSWVGKWRPSK